MRGWISSACVLLVAATAAGEVGAQQEQQAEDLPRIRITDPNRDLFRLGVPNAAGGGDAARQATEIARRDFGIVGMFQVLDPLSFPPALHAEGLRFSSALWSQVGAQGVTKIHASGGNGGFNLEGRLYQTGRGDSPVLSKTYRGPDLRQLVHQWANDVIQQLTGVRGVFGSRIAFAVNARRGEIGSVGMDGAEAATLTHMESECLLPAYSPNGREVAFTSFLRGTPDLWIVSAGGGRARRVSSRPGLNTGATYYSDGSALALTLSHEGNPELYKIKTSDGAIIARLTRAPGIDSSPSLSPDGAHVAFVSDRQGTPQIFVMPASGGAAKRLTFQGGQNTTPRWNPRPDKPLIAFTGRDERATFDIFYYDMRTGKIERVTQNQGSNFDPAWSPDGRLLVYASSRGGLWVTNPETRQELQIYTRGARNPSWGPAPK